MRRLYFLFLLTLLWATPLFSQVSELKAPSLREDTLIFDDFEIRFERTLRIPDDGKSYPLPPSLVGFPIYRVKSYAKKLPAHWKKENALAYARQAFFIPMYQREAMWISFSGPRWKPRAVKIGVGGVNALTGEKWSEEFKKEKEQDYLVAPIPQLWIDGIKSGKGTIRQFVAMPLGKGYTVEGQITGKETVGGIQVVVSHPKKGKFKKPKGERGPREPLQPRMTLSLQGEGTEMGIGAGGTMKQKIYPDPHGFDTWDIKNIGVATIYIVNSEQFEKITGEKPPKSPITKKDYELAGYPWFALYDKEYGDLPVSQKLKKVQSVQKIDKAKGVKDPDEKSMMPKKVVKHKIPTP